MKWKTTLTLLAIVVALGVWIKFYESQAPNTADAKRLAGNVLNFEKSKLEGLSIQNGDDRIELRRVDEKWRLETPINDQADRSLIDRLLADLEDWQKDDTITGHEMEQKKISLEEYDLAKPKLRLRLLGKEMPPEIWFGKDSALKGKMYVRFANAKDTFLVRQNVRSDITKKPEEFRDRKLTELTAAQVARVVLKTSAGELEVEKQGENWEILKPLRARGDRQKVSDLIAQVTSARIEQFVADDRGDLQPYGLAEARGSVTLFKTDDKEGQTLQIGTVPENKEQVYVRFVPRAFVYTVPKKMEEVLNTKPADLRDRHVARIDTNNLDRITLDAAGRGKTVLARKEQSWTIASRQNQPANSVEVTKLIDTLTNEQVVRFVEDVASDLPKYGLDEPQLQITLSSFASENTAESGAGEHPFATISFGKAEGDVVYARVGEEPFIVAVRRAFVESIATDPVQWQTLDVFRFKPEEVHRLTVTTDHEVALARGANNEWGAVDTATPVNAVNVQSLLNTLTKLRAVRWIGGPMPPQAFDQVQASVDFTTSPDDKAAHKLVVGGPAGDGMWYGRVEGRDGVFVINNPDFNALRLPLVDAPVAAPQP